MQEIKAYSITIPPFSKNEYNRLLADFIINFI